MKRFKLSAVFLVILTLTLTVFWGCSKDDGPTSSSDDGGDNTGGTAVINDTREAYDTLLDFATAKQIMLIDYLAIMTNDYTSGFMEKDLTYEQIDKLFESIYSLAEYTDDVETALAIIESDAVGKPAQAMRVEGLGKALRDFISWMPGSAAHSRNRILQVASNMSAGQRTILYDNLRPHWKLKVKNEGDYWKKLQDGDLDFQAPQMFNHFFEFDQDLSNFGTKSIEKGLRIIQIAHREGAEGVTLGAKVMLEAVKTIAPATKLGMDLVEKTEEYREKANKVW